MTGLEQAFYIVGIVFMGLMLAILLGVLAAVVVIRKRIVDIHDSITEKFSKVANVAAAGERVVKSVTKVVNRSK